MRCVLFVLYAVFEGLAYTNPFYGAIPRLSGLYADGACIESPVIAAGYRRMVSVINDAIKCMADLSETFEPDPAAHETYCRLYSRVYKRMYPGLKPLFREMTSIVEGS